MALPAELVRATAEGLQYRARAYEAPRALEWPKLFSVSAAVQAAWGGAEVTVSLGFDGDSPAAEGVPLAGGRRLEVFGYFPAARAIIEEARERAPQALVGPQAQLLTTLPQPEGGDERYYRRKLKEYAFARAAGLALGKLHLWQGRLEVADNDFQRVASRSPLETSAWRWLGLTRLLAGKGMEAEAALDGLIALGARDTHAYYLDALSVYRQRRFTQAAEEFGRVVRAWSGDPAVRDLLVCSLVQEWRITEALRELEHVAADHREGWRLMARKCQMCAAGYRVYQERMSTDRAFRWREWWKSTAARAGTVISIFFSAAQSLWRRHWWVLLIVLPLGLAALYAIEKVAPRRRVQDRLADAQGQVPNLPCWYVSLISRPGRAHILRRWVTAEMQRHRGGE